MNTQNTTGKKPQQSLRVSFEWTPSDRRRRIYGCAIAAFLAFASVWIPYREWNVFRLKGRVESLEQERRFAIRKFQGIESYVKLLFSNAGIPYLPIDPLRIDERLPEIGAKLDEQALRIAELEGHEAKVREQRYFRPLRNDIKNDIVTGLRRMAGTPTSPQARFVVNYNMGDLNRQQLAQEIAEILSAAGFEVEGPTGGMFFATEPQSTAVKIETPPDKTEYFVGVWAHLHKLIRSEVLASPNPELPVDRIDILVFGSPKFDADGTVTMEY